MGGLAQPDCPVAFLCRRRTVRPARALEGFVSRLPSARGNGSDGNRMLQELRAAKLIVLRGKSLVVPEIDRLMDTAPFNGNYLHMEREGRQLDAND